MADDSQDKTRTGGDGTDPDSGTAPMKRLGDFEILSELGRGGMGVVYEARQTSLNRRVALKVLPPGLGLTGEAVRRFHREAQAAAKLHHTNIVPVHAIGEEEGCHYYAMELIEGQALSEVLKDLTGTGSNPLLDATVTRMAGAEDSPAPDPAVSSPSLGTSGITSISDTSAGSRKWFDAVAKLVSEVADALEYAHGRGVIHRDIKPANLMLSGDGRLCITDFGLARVAQEPGMTVSGSLMGTPAYMSPEQITAGRVKLDHRTDVYSLGAVLYEMLTNRRPFPGENREEILGGILTKDPRPPRRFNPRIPVDLETICQKAMEKDPDKRYATAGEFAEDLRRYLAHGLIKARRAGIAKRIWKSIRRHPVASTVILGMIVVSVLGFVTWKMFLAHRKVDLQRLASDARLELNQGDIQGALDTANAILVTDPTNIEGHLIRSRVHFFRWRYWDAVNDAREVLRQDPDNREAHLLIATIAGYGNLHSIPIDEHLAAIEDLGTETADAMFLRGLLEAYGMGTKLGLESNAITWFTRALEKDPGHVLALFARSKTHRTFKDLPAALSDAEKLVVAQPRSALGYIQKSRAFRALHDEEAALEAANRAIELDAVSGDGYFERSRIHGIRGNTDEEIADLTRAIELNPTEVRYHLRASAYRWQGEYDRAIEDAKRCLEIDPDYAQCYQQMWIANLNSGREEEALLVLEEMDKRAETWVSDMGRLYQHLMWLEHYRETGDLERADDKATRIIELLPNFIEGYIWRAEIRLLLYGREGVVEDCDQVAGLHLETPVDIWSRGTMLRDTCGRIDAALADYTEAIRIAPSWAEPYLSRAIVFLTNKQNNKAMADLDRAVELTPNWGRAIYRRGRALEDLERFEEALDQYEMAAKLGVAGHSLHFHQAITLYRLGREEDALRTMQDFIEREPTHWPARLNLAVICYNIGRIEEAVRALDEALEIIPDQPTLKAFRAYFSAFGAASCHDIAECLAEYETSMPADPTGWTNVAIFHGLILASLCPDMHEPERAFKLARKSVEYAPNNDRAQGALGISLYRLGRYEEARQALLRSLELEMGGKSSRFMFALAMADWKLGERETALTRYREGVAEAEKTRNRRPDMIMIRGEAAELLGIAQ